MNKTEKANAKLMRSAGFKRGYVSAPSVTVWERGDLRVATGPVRMTLAWLVQCVIEQAAYRMRQSAVVDWRGFKTDNKTGTTKGDS